MPPKINFYKEWKKNLGNTRPWDLLNPKTQYVSDEEANNRLDICKSCPFFIQMTSQCKKCGCFMQAKTKMKHAECPVKKW